jgi:GntR family transcriptional regulator
MTMLDRTSPLPLYHQLKQALLARLREEEFGPGMPLPTELELIDQYKVSRITVRRAMAELERSGQIYRVSGKGTFVKEAPLFSPELTRLTSFTEDMREQALDVSSKLLDLRQDRASEVVAEKLDLKLGAPIWFVGRLRLSDQYPLALNLSYLRLPPSFSLSAQELEQTGSLWALLEKKGIVLRSARRTIQAIPADFVYAAKLQVEVGAPLLLIEGVVRDQNQLPVEYHLVINRGDRYKHSLYLER